MEGLRGLAVLLVFFVHFDALFGGYVVGHPLLARPTHFLGLIGNTGVDLFFVISGYLIYGALIRRGTGVVRFILRRVERIYPTFLAVFALYIFLSLVFPDSSRIPGRTWPQGAVYIAQNLLLLPGIFRIQPIITVAWSLSYEFFFYIAGALLIRAVRMWTWTSRTRSIFFMAGSCGYLAVCFSTTGPSHVRAMMFLVGILLYEALLSQQFINRLSGSGEIIAILALLSGLIYIYLLDASPHFFEFLPGWLCGRSTLPGVPTYQGPYKTLVLSFSLFWFVAYSFAFDGRLKRLFVWQLLRYLGNMSYSYYLIHGVTAHAVALIWAAVVRHHLSMVAAFVTALPIALGATWLTATVLFVGIEKPFSLSSKRARRQSITAVLAESVHG
jgi:peptidoglycan/LPS O-acetylase OafA/YrhL